MPKTLTAAVLTAGLLATTALFSTTSVVAADAASAKTYKNCDAMHKDYPHGVGRKGAKDKTSGKKVTNFKVSNALYAANTKSDRDHDKIACEKA